VKNSDLLNAQGKALGFATGDILIKVKGETIPAIGPELFPFFIKHKTSLKEGDVLSYTVIRGEKEIELKAPLAKTELKKKFVMTFDQNASPEKLALRQTWLSAK